MRYCRGSRSAAQTTLGLLAIIRPRIRPVRIPENLFLQRQGRGDEHGGVNLGRLRGVWPFHTTTPLNGTDTLAVLGRLALVFLAAYSWKRHVR